MKKILDKFVTGFFVVVLGALWYCTRGFVKPTKYKIVTYDMLGHQVNLDGIRTSFNTSKVANNFLLEYQNRFLQYNFSMSSEIPTIKRRGFFEIFKKNYR